MAPKAHELAYAPLPCSQAASDALEAMPFSLNKIAIFVAYREFVVAVEVELDGRLSLSARGPLIVATTVCTVTMAPSSWQLLKV